MNQISLFLAATVLALTTYALPQNVQLIGSFNSARHGGSVDVVLQLKLKKESATKAKYKGTMTFVGQVLGENQSMEFTINKSKNKSEGVVNTYDGYIAFDTKTAYSMDLGQQLTMPYAEYRRDDTPDLCNPIHDNFCRPMNRPPVLTDRGQLVLTVTQAQ